MTRTSKPLNGSRTKKQYPSMNIVCPIPRPEEAKDKLRSNLGKEGNGTAERNRARVARAHMSRIDQSMIDSAGQFIRVRLKTFWFPELAERSVA